MTKGQCFDCLRHGMTLSEIFHFRQGQDCLIFKSDTFTRGDDIIYIPDVELNEIPIHKDLSADIEGIFDVMKNMYTGEDFFATCDGKLDVAERVFQFCDWQHPISAYMDLKLEE